jgi:ribosomal subunit interface protein
MRLEVTFKNLQPKEEIRRRASALFGKLERFLDSSSEGLLILRAEHGRTITELTVSARGQVFQASDEDEELRTSLDRTFHTIETSLRRAKERRVDRRRRNDGEVTDGFVDAADVVEDDDELTEAPTA